MLQTRNSRWTALTALLCALLVVAAWFLLIGPRRSEAADLEAQREQAAQQNDALQLQIAKLKAQYADLPARQAELAAIRTQLPTTADLPLLIRDINRLTEQAGVGLTSITPSTPTEIQLGGSSAASSSTDTADDATGAGSSSAGSSVSGALYAIPVTFVTSGDYFATAQFVRLVQTSMNRAFLVTGVDVATADDEAAAGDVQLTLAGQIYVLLDADAQAALAQGISPTTLTGTDGSTGTSSTPGTTDQGATDQSTTVQGGVTQDGATQDGATVTSPVATPTTSASTN